MYEISIKETIIYEDKDLLVCHKPAGMAVQSARFGTMDMENALKNYLAVQNPGKMPYLGIVHRLDQPVEGLLVFAKTPQAAKDLSRQISSGQTRKEYLAVTSVKPLKSEGILEDYLKKDSRSNSSHVVTPGSAGAKKARLYYREVQELEDSRTESKKRILLRIRLETGRHHQIRVQLAHAGMPLLGDRKYHPQENVRLPLGLCSCRLVFLHPKTKKEMIFHVWPKGETFAGFQIKDPTVWKPVE